MKKVKLASFEKQIARATVAMCLSKNYSAAGLDAARLETEVSRYIGNMDSISNFGGVAAPPGSVYQRRSSPRPARRAGE